MAEDIWVFLATYSLSQGQNFPVHLLGFQVPALRIHCLGDIHVNVQRDRMLRALHALGNAKESTEFFLRFYMPALIVQNVRQIVSDKEHVSVLHTKKTLIHSNDGAAFFLCLGKAPLQL